MKENNDMNTQHTPGPWTACGSSVRALNPDVGHPYAVGVAVMSCDPLTEPLAAVNARLIAAAPELLEALKLVTAYAEDLAESENAKAVISICKAAIAKATGN